MSLLTNQTNINQDQAFFLLANMSSVNSGSISTAQITTSSIGAITANVSTLVASAATVSSLAATTAFISTASVQQGTFSSIYTGYISSGNADLQDITTSTIFATAGVFIDGAELTTSGGTELLLNGVPIATTSNLSTLADWAYEPAISSVNMSGFDVLNGGLISSLNVRAGSAFFNNLLAWNVLAVSSFTSTISSLSVVSENVSVSSITQLGAAPGGSYITFNGGDIILNSAAGGAGVFLTPADEVAIQDPATGQTYGLLAQYIRGVSSINDVSTINGLPYPYLPPGTGSTISTFQTLTATDYVSSAQLFVSSINGSEFNQNSIIISTFVSDSLSSVRGNIQLSVISTLQLAPSASFSPNLNIDMGLGNLFTNVAGAALGGLNLVVGGIALATGVTAMYQARQKNTIQTSNFELVNGMTQLQFSTLGQDVSSILRFVSSVNEQTPGEEYFISTIIPAGITVVRSFSDPMNTISSPSSTIQAFGQWVELPGTGAISTIEFSTLSCSTLVAADLVSTFNLEVQNIISTNGLSAQYVIGEQIISTPQLFVSSINNDIYPPTPPLVSSFPGNIYVSDSIFAANLVSSFNMLVGNTISTNGASAQYVIGEQLISTPQLFVSSINGASITPSTFTISSIQARSVSTGTTTAATLNATAISSATATISSITANNVSSVNIRATNINSIPTAGYRTVIDYSSRIIWSSISTSYQTVASTTITTLTSGLVNVNWNTSLLSAANAKHNSQMYVTLNGVSSFASYTTTDGIGHYANASSGFTTSVAAGTYVVQGLMNCDTNGVATVVNSWITAQGNLLLG